MRNHKFFLLFLFYVFLMCAHAALLITTFGVAVANDANRRMDAGGARGGLHAAAAAARRCKTRACRLQAQREADVAREAAEEAARVARGGGPPLVFSPGLLVVLVCSVLFGLFTACMMCDQWSVATTNVAKIDRLKGEEHPEGLDVSDEVNEVFGGLGVGRGFRATWLLPTEVRFPASLEDDIMGYTLPAPAGCPPCCGAGGAGGAGAGGGGGGGFDGGGGGCCGAPNGALGGYDGGGGVGGGDGGGGVGGVDGGGNDGGGGVGGCDGGGGVGGADGGSGAQWNRIL